MAAINKEILALGRTLAALSPVDVYHTAPVPLGARSAPKEHWVQAIPEEGGAGVVMGLFQDRTGADYVMVANRDRRLDEGGQLVICRLLVRDPGRRGRAVSHHHHRDAGRKGRRLAPAAIPAVTGEAAGRGLPSVTEVR